MSDTLAVLAALRLEDGRRWGEVATGWQRADAAALIDPGGPRRHWWSRSRGASKTGDAAGALLALLLAEAPERARAYAFAADRAQAGLLLDALAGYVARAGPALAEAVEVGASTVTVRTSGARLTVEAADAASSFGLRPWATVADELAQWPATHNHRRLWASIASAVPKVPGSRLLVTTTPGSPSHWSHDLYANAETSEQWRVSVTTGPSPWWSAEDLEAVRADLTPAEYRRLIDGVWAEADDALTTRADVASLVDHLGPLEPRPGVRYQMALDIGLRNDATVLVIAHLEHRSGRGRTVVVDRLLRWRGTRAQPVELGDVEAALIAAWHRYNRPPLIVDPWQAAQLAERVTAAGVKVHEHTFTPASIDRLARTLYGVIRDRTLALPDDKDLLAELAAVRLVEVRPGVIRLDHRSGSHDDQAVAIALAATVLLDAPTRTRARAISPARRAIFADQPSVIGGRAVETAPPHRTGGAMMRP